jgi:outer membrane protein
MKSTTTFLHKATMYLLATLFLAVSSLAYAQAADKKDPGRIGFLDLDKAIGSTLEFKKKLAELDVEADKEKNILKDKEKKLLDLAEELKKQDFVLSEDLKRKKAEGFRVQQRDFERYVADIQEKFNRKKSEIIQAIGKKMADILKTLGKERNYILIMEKRSVYYHAPEDDLTDIVVSIYDKNNK